MLILKYYLTEDEYFDYMYYTEWAAPHKKGYRIRYYLRVFFLYGAIAALYIFTNHSHQVLIDLVIFSVIATLYFLLVPILIRRAIRRRVRDILDQPENKHVLGESEVVLMDTGITDKDNASESNYTWEAIVRKAETVTSYYLYTNSHHAIVIPKRVVGKGTDKQELERLLNQHLPLSSEFPER
jgi:RNase P protein component